MLFLCLMWYYQMQLYAIMHLPIQSNSKWLGRQAGRQEGTIVIVLAEDNAARRGVLASWTWGSLHGFQTAVAGTHLLLYSFGFVDTSSLARLENVLHPSIHPSIVLSPHSKKVWTSSMTVSSNAVDTMELFLLSVSSEGRNQRNTVVQRIRVTGS
jgi:hypothetical protein